MGNGYIRGIRAGNSSLQGRMVMPTYHTSAWLRKQALKRPVWKDLKKVITEYRELIDRKHYSRYN